MIAFPKSIKDGDIELVKFEPTFENATKVFYLLDKHRAFIDKHKNNFGKVKKRKTNSIGLLECLGIMYLAPHVEF